MRRNYNTFVLAVGVAVMLLVLGVLQYRWQSEIAENEAMRMRKMAQEEAGRFAEDFNKEIQNAYFNFQVGADDWRAGNYHPFIERYDFWRQKTAYPDLIANFYFFDAAGKDAPVRFDAAQGTFTPVEWTPELRNVFSRTTDEKKFRGVNDDIFTLLVPQHETPTRVEHIVLRRTPGPLELGEQKHADLPPDGGEPKTYGYLAISLDPKVITDKILPAIAEKDLGDGEFQLRVTDRSGSTVYQTANISGEPDARSGLFQLSPNDMFFFENRDLANAVTEQKQNVLMSSRVESRTMTSTEVRNKSEGTVRVEIQSGDKPKTQIISTMADTPGEHWTLALQHKAGSIDAFVAQNKNRNLGLGFGILGLLGISAGAIIYSAQRAKAFAQRQVDFVSSVSHEFRTPLAVIYSAGENLADGVTKDRVQTSRYGELIKTEGRKLSSMVEQILEFAGANSGKRKYKFRPTSVSEVVNDAVDQCRALAVDQQIKLELDADRSLPTIEADADALSRAIQNLITNSVKYCNGGNWIRVSATNGGQSVTISVEDRGIGISKPDLKQIFEPFYRAKDVVDAQIHGNGLGLSLVKQIVEAHGGRVDAESELGVGSKFTIEIPCN